MTLSSSDAERAKTSTPPATHRRRGHGALPMSAAVAVALLSWTFPRIGPLKFTEVLALLSVPQALSSGRTLQRVLGCYGPFLLGTLLAGLVAMFTLGNGDNSITSEKGLYSTPGLTTAMTLIRTFTYVMVVASITHFFRVASAATIQRALSWSYVLTLIPGFLQMFRMYSGIHFDLPYFERPGLGPFSGVFDAGYVRLMGFEFEPLGYATSLMIGCCLRVYARGTIPWMGILVLGHTFSAGAFAALFIALALGFPDRLRRLLVPMYLLAFIALCVTVWTNLDELLETFLLVISISERINALGACINMWMDYPLGVGAGLYGYFFNLYDKANLPALQLDFYPNNDPAMFLATGGVLYLFSYLWIFHRVIVAARSRWLRIALVALLVQSISSYMLFNPAAAVVMSLALSGRLLTHPARRRRAKRSTVRRTPALRSPTSDTLLLSRNANST